MKIFLLDNDKIMKKIKKQLEEEYVIESKNDCNFKMTKNDFAIINNFYPIDGIEKLKNIIFLTNNKEYNVVWNLATTYKTIDVIDCNQSDGYIINRIQKIIRRDV